MSEQELLGNTGIRWSAESIQKAESLIEDGKVRRDDTHDDVFFVAGSEAYRVQTDGHEYITCTCPNGMARSRPNCYHTAAVLMFIQDKEDRRPTKMIHYVGEGAGEECTSEMVHWFDDQTGICHEHDRRVRRAS